MPNAMTHGMRTAGSLDLALRTIVVTTRAAIATHRKRGNDDLVRASLEQGLGLLDDLVSQLPSDTLVDERRNIEEARRVLSSLAEGG